jgi:hypothetical protein
MSAYASLYPSWPDKKVPIIQDKVKVNQCAICGQDHGMLKIVSNEAGDKVVICPNTGKQISAEYYE